MKCCTAVAFAVLFGVILPSINGLSCYTCSHTVGGEAAGGVADTNCRDALTSTTANDDNPACIVAGMFNGSKSMLQMQRSSEPGDDGSGSDVPYVNKDCQELNMGETTMYVIVCVCFTDNCNTYIIDNCTCETPPTSTTSTTSTTSILTTSTASTTPTTSTTTKTPTTSTTTRAKNAALPPKVGRILPVVLAMIATAAARLF